MLNASQSAKVAKSKERKAKRAEKRKALGLKPKRSTVTAQLDLACGLFIKMRDRRLGRGLCRICETRTIQVWYHIIPRGSHSTRWHPLASCGACAPCNMGEKWHRLAYREKHIKIFGLETYERLEAMSREPSHFSTADLIVMRDAYRDALALGVGVDISLFESKAEQKTTGHTACTHPAKEPCFLCGESFCPSCDPEHRSNCRDAHKP